MLSVLLYISVQQASRAPPPGPTERELEGWIKLDEADPTKGVPIYYPGVTPICPILPRASDAEFVAVDLTYGSTMHRVSAKTFEN